MKYMRIQKWTPYNSMFNTFFDDDFMKLASPTSFAPAMDISVDEDNVVVEVPLAGIKPEDVQVSIEDGVLTIQGKSEEISEEKKKDYYRKEIQKGSFFRSITLPVEVDEDNAEADSEDGMMKIRIPKLKKGDPKKITVKVNKK